MSGFSFWSNWVKSTKALWLMLLVLFAGSILCFIAAMLTGDGLVFEWLSVATLEPVKLPLERWSGPLLNLELEASSYVVRQTFLGSEMQINIWPAHILLVLVSIGLSAALAVLSSLRRLWFLVGMGLFCAMVVGLRLEQLHMFGRIDKTGDVIMFLLFLPLSYFFHAVKPTIVLLRRFIAFLALFILMGLLIYAFAGVHNPFFYVANYGLPAFITLSVLLIVLVSPEIIAGILYLVTASNNEHSRQSLTHFSVASLIYLLNLALYYLEVRGILDLGLYTINPFWILLISLLVALWTLNAREEAFGNIIPYQPQGAMLYVSLAIICLATMSYVFVTANDPFIETFEDAILYTHLGFGALFFVYILVNFLALLKENKRVYRVLYKPKYVPLFSIRLAGLVAVIGMYSLHGMYALYQPMGGYYNSIGDLYTVSKSYYLAEQYYKLGSDYKYGNHRSNYALASLASKADKPVQAMLFLKEGIDRQPTPYAYANLANLYFNNNLFFDGLFTLKEGIERYPQEGRLYNNLGLEFGKTNVLDSALYYLNIAAKDPEAEEEALANQLAIVAQKGGAGALDSIAGRAVERPLFYQNNLLAFYNRQKALKAAGFPEVLSPAELEEIGGLEAAYLLNYALLLPEPDSSLVQHVQQLVDSALEVNYEEPAVLALAVMQYKQDNHYAAFSLLRNLAHRSVFNNALYLKLLGVWSLELQAPALAASYFNRAAELEGGEAAAMEAIAFTRAGKPEEAIQRWRQLPDSLLNKELQQLKTNALLQLEKGNAEKGMAEDVVAEGELDELYRSARKAAAAGDTVAALQNYNRIFSVTPFLEKAYLSGIPLFNEAGKDEVAYDFLLKGIHFNPYSAPLKELYILQSLQMGLEEYAEDELLRLEQLTDKEYFEQFVQEYERMKQKLAADEINW
ncbi:tetratricopeptide repeat protein [Nafulsella turpanensis]|uniref:tetratricopeptide repeat protein n=1 Tax=Nafulsella turpanensis TaxID=1265690 RepID=UPI00034685ED|nr:hypothetical protein [Nafulsella turpanensis]